MLEKILKSFKNCYKDDFSMIYRCCIIQYKFSVDHFHLTTYFSPNCAQPSGANEKMAFQMMICCEAEG